MDQDVKEMMRKHMEAKQYFMDLDNDMSFSADLRS